MNIRNQAACGGWFAILIFELWIMNSSCFAGSEARIVKDANRLYNEGKYDEALKGYNDALTNKPDSAIINFNMGSTHYKKGDYEKAVDSFVKSLATEDKGLEAQANYNIGSCKYRLGILKENTDIQGAVNLLRESLDYYKRAIELDEKDEDAKFNHEFVEKKLKSLLDKFKRESPAKPSEDKQKESQKQEKQEGEQKKESQEHEKQEGEQKKEPQEQAGTSTSREQEKKKEETEKKSGEEDKARQENTEETKEPRETAQPQEEPKEMSEQEAKMLLEGYREEEPKGDLKDLPQRGHYPEVLKDW